MPPRITAIVCTLDRPQLLRPALESLAVQSYAAELHEILVVDNGSSTPTADVVDAARRGTEAAVRLVVEPERGVSRARNRGIAEARGDVLAFTDDDARVAPDWLERIGDALDRRPDVDAVGGPVEPDASFEHPEWLPHRMLRHLSLLDLGPRERVMPHEPFPFGVNMALRRSVFERIGGFDPELGRDGRESVRTGEETHLFRRLVQAGGHVLYDPTVVVRHTVDPERLDPAWLLRQARAVGHSQGRIDRQSRSELVRGLTRGVAPLGAVAGRLVAAAAGVAGPRRLEVLARCFEANRLGYLDGISSGGSSASLTE